ncbi:MAG: hydroxyacylglutathione hydrolase [Ottowia sp.]|nr:hydroxyacylglutathione hydrolase [Ottowia sp.]
MNLLPVHALADNYIWLLHDGNNALVVDPGEAAPALRALDEHHLRAAAILVTHHHADHCGGVRELYEVTSAPIFAPAHDGLSLGGLPVQPVRGGDTFEALGLRWRVLDVPGHTAGHMAYFTENMDGAPLLFCGDALFCGGCGRIFEGTPAQMLASLDALAALPGSTRVCAAHEYTLANLRFAQLVEPDNTALAQHLAHCEQLRAQERPTLPSTIALEQAINPFLRSRCLTVIQSVRAHSGCTDDEVAVFAALREWKNQA